MSTFWRAAKYADTPNKYVFKESKLETERDEMCGTIAINMSRGIQHCQRQLIELCTQTQKCVKFLFVL